MDPTRKEAMPRAPVPFRQRVNDGEVIVGIFLKCFHPTIVEAAARSGTDCVILDLEHAPESRDTTNIAILAARACGCPCLIRLPDLSPAGIQQAVTVGTDGIFLPHVNNRDEASSAVAFARGLAAERAVAGFPRAAASGTSSRHGSAAAVAERLAIILQVDEPDGVSNVGQIAQVDADGIFVGRFGLALRHGTDNPRSPEVERSLQSVAEACRAERRAFGMYLPDHSEAGHWISSGASFFVVGTDIGFLTASARSSVAAFREKVGHVQ